MAYRLHTERARRAEGGMHARGGGGAGALRRAGLALGDAAPTAPGVTATAVDAIPRRCWGARRK
jgi:hypothetical protein